MFKRILKLSPHLANQIAAGEVIERPASVLKELLENSLDANSTQIEISIEKGGIDLICVQDNGTGICKEDLNLAVAPHATSKIQALADLESVMSYGFRGEALASISGVSKLEVVSSVIEQEFSWSLLLEGRNQAPLLMPAPKRLGTLVAVRDLFYNTPARRKFLKSEKTEILALEEVFKRAALSQPGVAFKYQQGDHLQKRLSVCQDFAGHAKRVAALCGQSFIQNAYFIEAEINGLKLSGWVGNQEAMRSQADLQYFYVNGRIVRDKVVMHAIRHAYEAIALPGRYPAYVLYFELDPTAVDVNVHPTKHEVRFREARTVHAFLSYAIQTGLKEGHVVTHPVLPTQVPFSLPHFEQQLDKPLRKPFYLIDNELLLLLQAEALMVVDIKALRRLYLAECFTKAYTAEGVSQEILLMPQSITFKKIEALLSETEIFWEKLGFNFSAISENVLLVRAIPLFLKNLTDHLAPFLPTLLGCLEVNQAIDCLVQHILEKEPISWEMSEALLATVKITEDCYKPLNAATLRKALSL